MVDLIRIISFGVILTVALLLKLSTAEPCNINAKVCEYTFKVEYQLSMVKGPMRLKAVNGKLYSVRDKGETKPFPVDSVITMDGYFEPRKVVAINGKIPGPAIEGYVGQTVVVRVENHLYNSDVTIHWHGLHQKGTPFMDGVPYVTQCPIGPAQSFVYRFKLTQTGTFWYHSHSGTQRTMGLYGAVIIRDKHAVKMPEHHMIVTDYNHNDDSDSIYLKISHAMFNMFNFHSCLVNGRGRFYEKPGVHNGAPLSKFTVKQGKKYRFRVIAAGSLYPFEVSVDGHVMKMVASDGYEILPRYANIFVINPGERFDFIIHANQPIGNYWIRGVYPDPRNNDKFEAILHYEGAPEEEPKSKPQDCSANVPCSVLNCGFYPARTHRNCIKLSQMASGDNYEVPRIVPGKWKEHFLNFGFPGPRGHAPGAVNGRNFKEPSVNSLYQPKEIDTLCDNKKCGTDKQCSCSHSLQLDKGDTVQLVFTNLGVGTGFDHPIHMHGHTFSVLKMVYPTYSEATGRVEKPTSDIDCGGDPKKNYCNNPTWSNKRWGGNKIPGLKRRRAPLKDTLILPAGGYAVVRIKADNPGLWFMHCHTEIHNMDGMAMMLNESFPHVPKAPAHFPECRSFTPEAISRIPDVKKTASGSGSSPRHHEKEDEDETWDEECD